MTAKAVWTLSSSGGGPRAKRPMSASGYAAVAEATDAESEEGDAGAVVRPQWRAVCLS